MSVLLIVGLLGLTAAPASRPMGLRKAIEASVRDGEVERIRALVAVPDPRPDRETLDRDPAPAETILESLGEFREYARWAGVDLKQAVIRWEEDWPGSLSCSIRSGNAAVLLRIPVVDRGKEVRLSQGWDAQRVDSASTDEELARAVVQTLRDGNTGRMRRFYATGGNRSKTMILQLPTMLGGMAFEREVARRAERSAADVRAYGHGRGVDWAKARIEQVWCVPDRDAPSHKELGFAVHSGPAVLTVVISCVDGECGRRLAGDWVALPVSPEQRQEFVDWFRSGKPEQDERMAQKLLGMRLSPEQAKALLQRPFGYIAELPWGASELLVPPVTLRLPERIEAGQRRTVEVLDEERPAVFEETGPGSMVFEGEWGRDDNGPGVTMRISLDWWPGRAEPSFGATVRYPMLAPPAGEPDRSGGHVEFEAQDATGRVYASPHLIEASYSKRLQMIFIGDKPTRVQVGKRFWDRPAGGRAVKARPTTNSGDK